MKSAPATSGLKSILRRGDPWVWLTGTGLAVSLLMIIGMIGVILANGLGFFWPKPLERVVLKDGAVWVGEVVDAESVVVGGVEKRRIQLRAGNRDITGQDFVWVDEAEIVERSAPKNLWLIERREYGILIGTPVSVVDDAGTAAPPDRLGEALAHAVRRGEESRERIDGIQKGRVGEINAALERARLNRRGLETRGVAATDPALVRLDEEVRGLEARYVSEQESLQKVQEQAAVSHAVFRAPTGEEKTLRAVDIFRAYPANDLSAFGRASVYASRLLEFLVADPRESNTEGGIFPALFGTVLMVLLMSLAAVPFGVVAAVYLREYATQGAFVRIVRIAVNNLAGVPSIVFGVFGLGFFVYLVGGAIDRVFFADALPTPTFGTGGLVWAALTLALLTVPVVIVATEEALAAVPRSMREASVAMGATQFQTICRVVLPAAAPGILTGLILAMARGAGEVAPLMITGVVKLAPELPIDGSFPFLHLERKFMHLAFHIYDVGFQSPNVEAAKPMVYTTTIFLLIIVITLNLVAIVVRNRLRRKYQTSAF